MTNYIPPLAHSEHLAYPKYRPDIDGLRAIAILSVVGFHAFPLWIGGGFIGVDIFFVISGFLISTIIFGNLENRTFSFIEFYSRRIRRIFPSLIVIFVACFVFGWFYLTPREYDKLNQHIVGGAAFISNFLLWKESGYFDVLAITKPLLHLWSLGIEEQFYIFWPLLLWLCQKKHINLFGVVIASLLISFVLNALTIINNPVADFYSPLTRFWELQIGSVLAWLNLYNPNQKVQIKYGNSISWLGIFFIFMSAWFLNQQSSFPGWWALFPTSGAALIIYGGPNAWVNEKILSTKFLVWIGLISFPLYLWHWPLLSFAHIFLSETPNWQIRILLVFASIICAWITFWVVEKPIRNSVRRRLITVFLIIFMLVMGGMAYLTKEFNGLEFRFSHIAPLTIRAGEYNCDQDKTGKACVFGNMSSNKIIVVYGDSHAGHLSNALNESLGKDYKIILFAQNCFLGPGGNDASYCDARKEEMRQLQNAKIFAVIRAQRWEKYLPINADAIEKAVNETTNGTGLNPDKIIIAGSTQEISGACELAGYYIPARAKKCPHHEESNVANKLFISVTKSLKLPRNVFFVYPYEKICKDNTCTVINGTTAYYNDDHHLTADGAALVMPDIIRILEE